MIVKGNGTALGLDERETEESAAAMCSPFISVLRRCNSFFMQGLRSVQGECQPLVACGRRVGVVRPDVAMCLLGYPEVFTPIQGTIVLNPQLDSYIERTNAVDCVLRDLHAKSVLRALAGWREERFCVWDEFGVGEPLFEVERSAVTPLGIRAYGTHITGYIHTPDGLRVWVQKRALDKPTYPGQLDSMVAGGVTAGLCPRQVMLKEAMEEAGIPEEIAANATPAGCVSFFRESERGLHANTEFVYDLELPSDFVPKNVDGEVDSFEAVTVEEYINLVTSAKYKLTSVPVALDFLVRHGIITPETEPRFPVLLELLHAPLHHLFTSHPPTNSPPINPTPLSDSTAAATTTTTAAADDVSTTTTTAAAPAAATSSSQLLLSEV